MTEEIKQADLIELYDDLTRQLQEDREKVTKLYDDLKGLVSTKEEYAVHGLTLAKFIEMQIKQTSHLIEIIRMNQKNNEKGDEVKLSDDEKNNVFEEIKDGH